MQRGIRARLRSPSVIFYEHRADNGALLYEAADIIDSLEKVLFEVVEREYNPFEPDNQTPRYKRLKALLDRL